MRALFQIANHPFLAVSSHGGKARKTSLVFFINAPILLMRALPSWPNCIPKTLPSNTITLGIKFQHTDLGVVMNKVKVIHSCLTLCNPMDCSLPGSSVRGILQARILEWVAMPFSRGSSQPRDWTQASCIAGRFFTLWAIREALRVVGGHKYSFYSIS